MDLAPKYIILLKLNELMPATNKGYTSCRFASGELPSVGSAQIASSELAGKGSNGG